MFNQLVPYLFNLSIIITLSLLLIGIMDILSENYKEKKIKGLLKTSSKIDSIKKMKVLKRVSNNLDRALKEYDREGAFNFIFSSIMISCLIVPAGLLMVKQVLLAILSPVIIIYMINYLLEKLVSDVTEGIEEHLPFCIDNIIRISSKYSDIRTILYESSRTCEQPIRGILEDMTREMVSSLPKDVLIKYGEKFDNVWFYSFTFTLISYLEEASKEDTLKNLKSLRDILDKENHTKKASLTDKKYGIAVNSVVCLSGVIGFILNLAINPKGRVFFFETFPGLLCFIAGFMCVFITFVMNIKMSKNKK